jgi:hypothetical protein
MENETMDEFYALFNGKEDIRGGGRNWELTKAHLDTLRQPLIINKCVAACMVFFEKPKEFLILGRSRNQGSGDGRGIGESVYGILPMLSETDYEAMRTSLDRDARRGYDLRQRYPERARKLNFSMIKRIALIGAQKMSHDTTIKIFQQWWRAYNGLRPDEVIITLAMCGGNSETLRIKKDQFDQFKYSKTHWNTIDWSVLTNVLQ